MPACGWEPSYAECSDTSVLDDLTPETKDSVEQMAVQFLWNWTGRMFGPCPVSYRPCKKNCVVPVGKAYTPGGLPWYPVLCEGKWYNVSCGQCRSDGCSCDSTPSLNLGWPVESIKQVTVDGVVLPSSAYRLDNEQLLVRIDGGQWPTCQDMSAPVTSEGTWEIVFTRGQQVPVGGRIAAGVLAVEMAKAICNDTTCALPKRIQTITRQGVTISLVDNFDALSTKGQTGLWLVDSWVASVNIPNRGARVRSVDLPQRRLNVVR